MDLCPSPSDVTAFDFRSGSMRTGPRWTPMVAVETIPLCELSPPPMTMATTGVVPQKGPNETLRKVHAQSSAETSGLGDSLQRIHALSSTETSGYGGETGAPSPTGQVSPYASIEDMPIGATVGAAAASSAGGGGSSSAGGRPSIWVVEKERTRQEYAAHAAGGSKEHHHHHHHHHHQRSAAAATDHGYDDASPPGHMSEEYYEDCFDDRKWQQIHERARQQQQTMMQENGASQHHQHQQPLSSEHRQRRRSSGHGDDEDEGLHVDGVSPRVGGRRRSSAGEGGGTAAMAQAMEGHFLGKSTQSAWLRWSHERRASFKRKVEFIEQRQNELQRIRMSSPVRKARKESMRFVSPELEDQHLTCNGGGGGGSGTGASDDVTLAHPAFPFEIPPPSTKKVGRKQDDREEAKLTLAQWNALVAFWEHDVFVRSRCVGLVFGLAALVLIIVSLVTSQWLYLDSHSTFGACHVGLWQICSSLYGNCTFIDYDKWQIAVIGMTMFSATFDSMALTLSIFGICAGSLPRKIYYYHSAGEIHLLCAIGCSVTLLLFPMTMESESRSLSSSSSSSSTSSSLLLPSSSLYMFGYGYFVVCGATACLCVAAFSMCLDDLIRTMARGVCHGSSAKV